MKSTITISMDSKLKKEAEELFSDLGLDFTTAVNVFVQKSIRCQGLPFTVRRLSDETLAAIREGRRIARDPNTPRFKTMEALIKDLNS
ncbi:MAG: type II toxin-antitoxin system RelB/DinJ family antitoxin [Kiritimatiellaeota bacterium]|nr:type II toxin-antitoxin system RelB/DinJ family antitoxin [Kiritimatiellota bacterium]